MKTQIKNDNVTEVIFRKWKNFGGTIALFPYELESYKGHVMSYERLGQHSGADYLHVIDKTVPAKSDESEYIALYKELESIGYKLKPISKRNKEKYYSKLRELPVK